ncbi:hypothetical protein SAY86_005450 [Trapa natans]|uniref:Copper transport protein n=1 Tax=Trapa natans TaxID=22666 RepID=A0AAN7QSH7_TRANT|nr:hypothetical protein SAY86_005450 [Trapa natans]
MMHMTFYWSKEVTLLVDGWHTRSWLSYSLSLLACFLASAIYQLLERYRICLKLGLGDSVSSSSSETADQVLSTPFLRNKIVGFNFNDRVRRKCQRVAEGGLFGVNSAIGYLLMLAVMSFNGGVFISIICGLTIGYLVFRSGGDGQPSSVAVDNPCACA